MSKRKRHALEFKAKVALEALEGEQTASELVSWFGVHSTMIDQWKRALLEGASGIVERCGAQKMPEIDEKYVKELHGVGELAVANDFLADGLKPWSETCGAP